MTVFVAVKPVSLTGAGIASAFDIFDNDYAASPRSGAEYKVTANAGNVRLDLKSVPGSPFTYAGSQAPEPPTGGKIASLEIDTGTPLSVAYTFSKMSLSVQTLALHIFQGNAGAVANDFLGGNDTITGSNQAALGDILNGFAGNDRITGRAGNDRINGGPGDDTLVFRAGFGDDIVQGFNLGTSAHHDTIELHSIPGLNNFANLKLRADDSSGHVVITADSGDSISLNNVASKSQLHAFDFHFLA